MSSKKISELTPKTTLADVDLVPIVDEEAMTIATKHITGANIKTEIRGTLPADVAALDGRLDTAETKIDTLQTDTTGLDTRLTTAEGDIDTLQSDVVTLDGRLDIAEPKITTLQGDVTTLTGRMTTAETNITGIQTTLGYKRKGTGNFGGYGSYTTITLNPALADTNYRVTIYPTADPGYVGGVWINNKATNSFRVNNSGSGVSAFEYAVEPY